jgi:hypothetical protein
MDKGLKHVKTYKIGNIEITCTPNHKFYTKEYGFIPLNCLMYSTTFCIFDQNQNTWSEKLLPITVVCLQGIQTPQKEVKKFTIQAGQQLMGFIKKLGYTFINTCVKLEKYLLDALFTILMEIHLTTTFQTLNAKASHYTNQNTCPPMKGKLCQFPILISLQGLWHPNGINQKKAENGTLKTHSTGLKRYLLSALNVGNMAKENYLQSFPNIVETNAVKEPQQEHLGEKQRVYDIMVEGEHEFFANGILVHNCFDYILCSAFGADFARYQAGDFTPAPMTGKKLPSKNSY